MIESTIQLILQYREGLVGGLLVTIQLAVIAWLVGIGFGIAIGVVAARFPGVPDRLFGAVAFTVNSVPILALLFWAHYPFQAFWGVVIDPFYTAAFLLSLTNTLGVATIVRHGVRNFPTEYNTAALVCGIGPWQTFWNIELPLLFRHLIPGVLNMQVVTLQATLFASLISVGELFRVAQQINALEYRPIEIYSAVALFFLAICLPLNALAEFLSRRYGRNLSEG